MTNTLALVSALYASTPDSPVPVQHDGKMIAVTGSDFFTTHANEPLGLSPRTAEGIAFLFGIMPDVDDAEEVYGNCAVPPTAAQYDPHTRTLIVAWALDKAATDAEAEEVRIALGMESLDEIMPVLPDLLRADLDIFCTIGTLKAAYCEPEADDGAEPETYGRLLDAIIVTPYNPDDHQESITASYASNAESKNWKPITMALAQFIERHAEHRVSPNKNGVSEVYADMVPGQRLKSSIKTVTAIGLDIDNGTPPGDIDAALRTFDHLCFSGTTHSNGRTETEFKKDRVVKFAPEEDIDDALIQRFLREDAKWHESMVVTATYEGTEHTTKGIMVRVRHKPMPKFRVIVPLEKPFVVAEEGATQTEAMNKWPKIPLALARLLGMEIDKASTEICRIFFPPRHPEGMPNEIRIYGGGGKVFDFKTLELDDPFETIGKELTKGTSKSVTDRGRTLGRWSVKYAHRFQITDVIADHCSEKFRNGSGKDVECPFDENHTNAGDPDDSACFVVNAGYGESERFVISCRHASCQTKTNLDMLGKMLDDDWFPESVLEDSNYNAISEVDDPAQPEGTTTEEHQGKKREALDRNIAALTPDLSDDTLKAIYDEMCENELGDVSLARTVNAIAERTQLKVALVRKTFLTVKKAHTQAASKAVAKATEDGRLIFGYNGEYNFDEATKICVKSILESNKKADLPVLCVLGGDLGGDPVRLVLDTKNGETKARFNYIENKALWSELNKRVTFIRRNEDGVGVRGPVPPLVADHVYEQCYATLREAPEVIYTPLFLADGSLMIEAKYHYNESGPDPLNILMIHNKLEVPPVSKTPDKEEMEKSLAWLRLELLSDFPFMDYDTEGNERREPSEANAIAMLITPFMRRMIRGRTPVFWVQKPTPGTGGTLLGQLPMWLFDGVAGVATRYSQNEEEMQKGLIAAIQERRSHLFFDDVKDFNNRELLRAITQENIGGRLLGSNKNIEVPNRFNWVGSGNNTVIHDEMRRRVVYIRMNAKTANIQERTFRHPDISGMGYEEFVRANRGEAIHHILTLIQYWIANGKQPYAERRRASFEEWSAKVGGVLAACGVVGFLDNLDSGLDHNMDEAANKQFIKAMLKDYGVDSLRTPAILLGWATDRGLDIVEGNNDDMKKSKFMKRLPGMQGQTFTIDGKDYMLQYDHDKEENAAFRLSLNETAPAPKTKKG